MSLFDALNERYARFDAARSLQHRLLVKAAGMLPEGFEKYLGMTIPYWVDEDGRTQRYVRLGVGSPSSFEEKHWPTLSSVGGVLSFSLAITVNSAQSRMTTVFEGSVCFCSDGYEFAFTGVTDPIIVDTEDAKNAKFTAVYSALLESLQKSFDPSLIEIRN